MAIGVGDLIYDMAAGGLVGMLFAYEHETGMPGIIPLGFNHISFNSPTFRNWAIVVKMPAKIFTAPKAICIYGLVSSEKRSCAKFAVPVNVLMIITGIVNHAFVLEYA